MRPDVQAAPSGRGARSTLLERDTEVGSLRSVIDGATEGEARLAVIEGPAGIGKTRLLAELRDGAERRDMRALTARASELERDFPFGVVRQLFEPALADSELAARWFADAAASALPVFQDFTEAGPDAEGASFATLHGLFWLTANAAGEAPLLLAVDDLHWCDRPSLRYFAYLLRRLEGLPVLVAGTLRSAEPGVDAALLGELVQDPQTLSVRPGPLSADGVAELVRERLGDDADRRFCAACHAATGGNPLLLRQLLTTLAADGVTPDASSADVVREIGPRAVSRTILLRLGRLSPEAVSVARAVAVLGPSADLPMVASLASLREDVVAEATRVLVRSEIIRPEPPLAFVHPLVRDAVYKDLSPGDRELQHTRAAELLRQTGAEPDQIATHLLGVPHMGEAWVAEQLQEAARSAIRKGAPDSAAVYLERALAEPPPRDQRPRILFELGLSETHTNGPAAVAHLRDAHESSRDPIMRGIAGLMLARTLMFTGHQDEAQQLARRLAGDVPDDFPDLRKAFRTLELTTPLFGAGDRSQIIGRLDEHRTTPETLGDKFLASLASMEWAIYGGGSAEECTQLALASLSGGDMFHADSGLFWVGALIVLALADSPESEKQWAAIQEIAHQRGSLFNILTIRLWRGFALMHRGDLAEAEDSLRDATRQIALWGSSSEAAGYPAAFFASVLMEKGDLAGARAVLGVPGAIDDTSDSANFIRRARAELALLEGDANSTLEHAEDLQRNTEDRVHPAWAPWRSLRAQALVRLDRRDEAIELAREELEIARIWGADATVGRSLRVLGEIEGERGLDTLGEALAHFERSDSKFEHARALTAFGMALRRARKPTDAREPLRRALDLATSCSAGILVEQARSELYASGARPRSSALGGVEALTDRELKVATLASEGESNRDIAQALYVTPKTVEVHLTNVYRKLGIGSRRELPGALAA